MWFELEWHPTRANTNLLHLFYFQKSCHQARDVTDCITSPLNQNKSGVFVFGKISFINV